MEFDGCLKFTLAGLGRRLGWLRFGQKLVSFERDPRPEADLRGYCEGTTFGERNAEARNMAQKEKSPTACQGSGRILT